MTAIAFRVGYHVRDVPHHFVSWWRARYRLWRFVRWKGAGRIRAILWDLAPSSFANKIPPVGDCGNHQWHSDLALLRYWTLDEEPWFSDFQEKLVPEDHCLYCKATRAVPGTIER